MYWTAEGKAYAVPIPSGEPKYLFTSDIGTGWFFASSPNGKRIRFTRGNKILEVGSDGSNLHEFLPGMKDSISKCCGSWTADGAFYIFASTASAKKAATYG